MTASLTLRQAARVGGLALLAPLVLLTRQALAIDPPTGRTLAWDAGPGAVVHIPALPGAAPLDSALLPAVDLSQMARARVALLRGMTAGKPGAQTVVQALCVRAPGADMSSAMELAALSQLNDGVQKELARYGRIDAFKPGSRRDEGLLQRQGYTADITADAAHGGSKYFARGKHQLGYLGDPAEMLLCSETCAQPADTDTCTPLVEATTFDATFVAPPQPATLGSTAHRVLALAGAVFGFMLLVGGIAIAAWPARRAAPEA